MSKNIIYVVIAVVVVAVLAGGYYLMKGQTDTAMVEEVATEQPQAVDTMDTGEVTVDLMEQNESGESGTATLKEVDGKVMVTVSTTGFVEGVSQPAHIHVGACPDVGAVVYPLNPVVDGASETELDATLEDIKGGLPLGLNVHKSQAESSVYTSCGDINL